MLGSFAAVLFAPDKIILSVMLFGMRSLPAIFVRFLFLVRTPLLVFCPGRISRPTGGRSFVRSLSCSTVWFTHDSACDCFFSRKLDLGRWWGPRISFHR